MRVSARRIVLAVYNVAVILIVMYLVLRSMEWRRLHMSVREREERQRQDLVRTLDHLIQEKIGMAAADEMASRLLIDLRHDLSDAFPQWLSSSSSSSNCGNAFDRPIVCRERYSGPDANRTWFGGTWEMEEDCAENSNWQRLVTVVAVVKEKKEVSDWHSDYPGVKVLLGLEDASLTVANGKVVATTDWSHLIAMVDTPFVLVGRDLRVLARWAQLERSLRLLQDPATSVAVVSGATRNASGHWRTSCYQSSQCDCMLCPVVLDAPFLARTELFEKVPLGSSIGQEASAFISWFMQLQRLGLKTLLCPDILYLTHSSEKSSEDIPRSSWHVIASVHQFQGVVLRHSPQMAHSFSCEEVGIACSLDDLSTSAHLTPWCCVDSYAHIISVMERLSTELGFHYELDSGSVLSAVKIGNFIPWDIDGDLYIPTNVMPLFQRSRYGPGYLRHSQSWRSDAKMENAFDAYSSGRFRLCEDPTFHACLEKYPADGNVLFNPDNFKEWRLERTEG